LIIKGIKIKNENPLIGSNISSQDTFEEEDAGKYTEVLSTEEILLTTDTFNDNTTLSYYDTDFTTIFKLEEASTLNMLEEDVRVNEASITIAIVLQGSKHQDMKHGNHKPG
jgi:hypothetical protein